MSSNDQSSDRHAQVIHPCVQKRYYLQQDGQFHRLECSRPLNAIRYLNRKSHNVDIRLLNSLPKRPSIASASFYVLCCPDLRGIRSKDVCGSLGRPFVSCLSLNTAGGGLDLDLEKIRIIGHYDRISRSLVCFSHNLMVYDVRFE